MTATSAGSLSLRQASPQLPRFQGTTAAPAISRNKGPIRDRNTGLKYGGPTEIERRPRAVITSGLSVPISTAAAATTRNRLLNSNRPSREKRFSSPRDTSLGARQAYRTRAPPTA